MYWFSTQVRLKCLTRRIPTPGRDCLICLLRSFVRDAGPCHSWLPVSNTESRSPQAAKSCRVGSDGSGHDGAAWWEAWVEAALRRAGGSCRVAADRHSTRKKPTLRAGRPRDPARHRGGSRLQEDTDRQSGSKPTMRATQPHAPAIDGGECRPEEAHQTKWAQADFDWVTIMDAVGHTACGSGTGP